MRIWFVVPVWLGLIAAPLVAQREAVEGKAWLDTCAEPATLNVAGLWRTKEWGRLSLNQRAESRRVIGSGDGWDIVGVVSGNTVCLLFSHNGKVAYSAKVTADGEGQLTGVYANGLIDKGSRTKPIQLQK